MTTRRLQWRKSTYSPGTDCVEMAECDERVALRNSNHPDAGTLHVLRPQMGAWIAGVRAGGLDDLV